MNTVSIISPHEIRNGQRLSRVFDYVDAIITTETSSEELDTRMSKMNDTNKEQNKVVIVILYDHFIEMQDIMKEDENKRSNYEHIFEGIQDPLELDEEKENELSRKNTLSIKYDYDEMGYQKCFDFEENYIFQQHLYDLPNRLETDIVDNEFYDYTGLLFFEVYK